jgi:hypothetical protein
MVQQKELVVSITSKRDLEKNWYVHNINDNEWLGLKKKQQDRRHILGISTEVREVK